jgi:hypothetical protein
LFFFVYIQILYKENYRLYNEGYPASGGYDMHATVEQALETVLRHWNSMAGAGENEAEDTADAFESSFYLFIDAVREWYKDLDERPQTLGEFMEFPLIAEIFDRLPAPLHLNFETEAELILGNISRINEEKYD